MNINFQTITGQKTSQDKILSGMEAKERTIPVPSGNTPVSNSGYALDIDATGFTDNAYAAHERSAKDISAMAQNSDIGTEHDFMILLSNTLSEEDYAKAVKDGYDLKDINSSEAVTIVDKIKSVLLESGQVIAGYNDDLSLEQLKKITGSESFARALQGSFHENDIPLTQENVKEARSAYEQVSGIKELDDAAVGFMVQNDMEPTIENVYCAAHSTNGTAASRRGFYAQDAAGYYAQKADSSNLQGLDSQIERIIEEAGLNPKDESLKMDSRWLITKGIPLTGENLEKMRNIKSAQIPLTEEFGAKAVAAAIADGKKAVEANLTDPRSNLQKAKDIAAEVQTISDENIKDTIAAGKMINIRNLTADFGADTKAVAENDRTLVAARLQLEEVRLRMTTEANKQLLDRGFSIDTAPMEELIERLKNTLSMVGDEAAGMAVDEATDITPQNAGFVAKFTITRIQVIANGPADVVGALFGEAGSASLLKISATAETMTARFRQAGEGYEKLMTAPRADFGDSIKKAFRNVDDILEDLGEEITEESRRAVRILGYNRMDINKENLEKVRAFDSQLQSTVSRLKPGAVLDLIRQGKNPLGMTMEELSSALDDNSQSGEGHKGKSEERYAKFLFKLEHKGEITPEERTSFIGIYRLFHTLKTTDYQAIGSLLKTDRKMTLENLLDATRNQKASRRGMDYVVDDEFGGLSVKENQAGIRIDQQIDEAFRYYRSKAQVVYENLEPEKLLQAKPQPDTLLPELADALKQAETDEELERAFVKADLDNIRRTALLKAAEPAAEEMKAVDIELTFNNLEAYISEKRDRKSGNTIWERMWDFKDTDLLSDALDGDDYKDTYVKVLDDMSDKLSRELMDEKDSYIDVRAISLLQKQISVMSMSAERESFEVPVNIDGDRISMNVTLKSDDREVSRMDASVQTFEYGLLTLSLYIEDGSAKGMLKTTNGSGPDESEYLEKVRTKLCEKIEEKLSGISAIRENIAIIYRAQSGPAPAGAGDYKAREGTPQVKTETRTLLTMAKAFIEAL